MIGSYDKTARLWDLEAKDPGADPVVLRGHQAEVTAVAISPNSRGWLRNRGFLRVLCYNSTGQIDSFKSATWVPTTMARHRSTFGGGTFLHWFRCTTDR